jgi:hypothetical protein
MKFNKKKKENKNKNKMTGGVWEVWGNKERGKAKVLW